MAAKFTSAAKAELVCSVCLQFFVKPHEPKNLPKCSHILCQICLQKMTEGGLKTVKCPQCNRTSPLSEEGIEGLTTSLALRNLAERHPEGIKQYKEYIQSQLKCGLEENTNKVAKLKELIKQTQDAIRSEIQEIEKAVETVMEKAQELIKQLRHTSGLDQLQERIAKMEAEIKQSEMSQSKLKTMADEEFHAQTDAITNQIDKLKIDDVTESSTAPCVGKFIANIHLGRIVKLETRKLQLVQEFGEFTTACSIASNSNGVLAVSDWKSYPQQVTVFRKGGTEYKLQSKFSVHPCSEKLPPDISISEEGKYLVTKCAAGFDVYSPDGKFQKTESVIHQQSGLGKMYVMSISIFCTKDGRILVGSGVKAEGEELMKYVVTVHEKGGSLMKTIPIGQVLPIRITDINGTHVAGCQLGHDDNDKVCIYDMQTGQETLSFDVQKAIGICYDEQSDCLLIGRATERDEDGKVVPGSGVIEQYCWITGKLVACLAHGLRCPSGLSITEDHMLAVTDLETVKLYKMD